MCSEAHARVFQHEFDHLNGILIPSRVSDPTKLLSYSVRVCDAWGAAVDDTGCMQLFTNQERWKKDWPTPGSHRTRLGIANYSEVE